MRKVTRDLSIPKLSNINEFLSNPDNYFANNITCCFGTVVEKQKSSKSKVKKITFVPEKSVKPSENLEIKFGTIYIPKLYCSVEIIDGQHRLYGYYDVSEEKAYEQRLSRRRASDALSVVAIEDPGENERPILFVDINSTQTKVRAANLWSLMRKIKPDTLMGYISNIVVALNEKGPFKDLIYIPGENTAAGRPLNLANIGKGIKDRKLVYKGDTRDWHQWNLFDQDRHIEKYPKTVTKKPLKYINTFFKIIKNVSRFKKSDWEKRNNEYYKSDWEKKSKGFLCTNDGVNVVLRILVEVRKFYRDKRMSFKKGNIQFMFKGLLNDPKFLRKCKKTARGEGGREDTACEIMMKIRGKRGYDYFAQTYLRRRRYV